jgi:sporulation protein YlmC with PRC-barrel domain
MVEKIIGSKVINMNGESIGKIENLVVDIDTGKILYAVLESGGFLGIGERAFSSIMASPGMSHGDQWITDTIQLRKVNL